MEEIEKMLGRELKKMEVVMYQIYKDNPQYCFKKDSFGNLKIEIITS